METIHRQNGNLSICWMINIVLDFKREEESHGTFYENHSISNGSSNCLLASESIEGI